MGLIEEKIRSLIKNKIYKIKFLLRILIFPFPSLHVLGIRSVLSHQILAVCSTSHKGDRYHVNLISINQKVMIVYYFSIFFHESGKPFIREPQQGFFHKRQLNKKHAKTSTVQAITKLFSTQLYLFLGSFFLNQEKIFLYLAISMQVNIAIII